MKEWRLGKAMIRLAGCMILATLFMAAAVTAQAAEEPAQPPKESVPARPVTRYPVPISLYHDNYFLLGNAGDAELYGTGTNTQYSKFQISISYRMFLWTKRADTTGLYFAYTQKSLWDLLNYRKSSPFIESNYSPEFFYKFDLENRTVLGINFERLTYIRAGLWEHESNGLDDTRGPDSRSWDRGYLELEYLLAGRYLSVVPKFWWIYHAGGENSDIARYLGYGQITLRSVIPVGDVLDLGLTAAARKGTSPDAKKGSLEFTVVLGSFRYHYREGDTVVPMGLYFQFFTGYGETLLQYNRTNRVFRAGFSFIN
jgi:phospholipase A1